MYGRPALRLVLAWLRIPDGSCTDWSLRVKYTKTKNKKTYYYKYNANRVALQYVLFTAQQLHYKVQLITPLSNTGAGYRRLVQQTAEVN